MNSLFKLVQMDDGVTIIYFKSAYFMWSQCDADPNTPTDNYSQKATSHAENSGDTPVFKDSLQASEDNSVELTTTVLRHKGSLHIEVVKRLFGNTLICKSFVDTLQVISEYLVALNSVSVNIQQHSFNRQATCIQLTASWL